MDVPAYCKVFGLNDLWRTLPTSVVYGSVAVVHIPMDGEVSRGADLHQDHELMDLASVISQDAQMILNICTCAYSQVFTYVCPKKFCMTISAKHK